MSFAVDLIEQLDRASRKTRRRLLGDREMQLEPLEDTLTQNLVSRLARRMERAGIPVLVWQIPRNQEADLYGADFALWVRDAAGDYAGVHFQSKKQYPNDTYRKFNQTNRHGLQSDMLTAGALRAGAFAGYAFFNGLPPTAPTATACGLGLTDPDLYGVSIASARTLDAHGVLGRSSIKRTAIENLCIPFGCLVRCGLYRQGPVSLPMLLRGSFMFEQGDGARLDSGRTAAPPYLRSLLDRPRQDFEWDDNDGDGDNVLILLATDRPHGKA